MTYILNLQEFYEFINQHIGEKFEKNIRNHLYPSKILDYLIANNIEFNRYYIENWVGFEYNNLDYDSLDFFNFMDLHPFDKDDFCFLITDDGLIEKLVFQFRLMDYDKLVSFYESRYNIDFFNLSII
jgi:hypothetical protein